MCPACRASEPPSDPSMPPPPRRRPFPATRDFAIPKTPSPAGVDPIIAELATIVSEFAREIRVQASTLASLEARKGLMAFRELRIVRDNVKQRMGRMEWMKRRVVEIVDQKLEKSDEVEEVVMVAATGEIVRKLDELLLGKGEGKEEEKGKKAEDDKIGKAEEGGKEVEEGWVECKEKTVEGEGWELITPSEDL